MATLLAKYPGKRFRSEVKLNYLGDTSRNYRLVIIISTIISLITLETSAEF